MATLHKEFFICDRCGKNEELKIFDQVPLLITKRLILRGRLIHKEETPVNERYRKTEFELCTNCANELEKWLQNGRNGGDKE